MSAPNNLKLKFICLANKTIDSDEILNFGPDRASKKSRSISLGIPDWELVRTGFDKPNPVWANPLNAFSDSYSGQVKIDNAVKQLFTTLNRINAVVMMFYSNLMKRAESAHDSFLWLILYLPTLIQSQIVVKILESKDCWKAFKRFPRTVIRVLL